MEQHYHPLTIDGSGDTATLRQGNGYSLTIPLKKEYRMANREFRTAEGKESGVVHTFYDSVRLKNLLRNNDYEFLFLFCLAVPMLVTKIEIN